MFLRQRCYELNLSQFFEVHGEMLENLRNTTELGRSSVLLVVDEMAMALVELL